MAELPKEKPLVCPVFFILTRGNVKKVNAEGVKGKHADVAV